MPNVLLSTNTVGAEIRYSTDGNDVTEESTLYLGQFSVEAGATVKAKAFKTGMNPSPQSELQSFAKLQTPTLSLSRNGSVINITLGNTVEGATYRYKVGSAPTSPTDGTAITGSATLDNSSALTIYVVGWKTGTYNPSEQVSQSVEQYVPTLQTPTLTLSRSGQTVTGTIGNTVSGATYVYKVGSSPSSQSDGTVISGTTFSFVNSSAVTVYVKGFMTGYNPSSAVSDSVSSYVEPVPTLPTPALSSMVSKADGLIFGLTVNFTNLSAFPNGTDYEVDVFNVTKAITVKPQGGVVTGGNVDWAINKETGQIYGSRVAGDKQVDIGDTIRLTVTATCSGYVSSSNSISTITEDANLT